MAETGENDSSATTANNSAGASNSGPNFRGGQTSGTTKLTEAASKLTDSQSCQC